MAILPDKNLLDGSKTPATTTGEMKLALGNIRDFLADLLGTDSSNKVAARLTLGAVSSTVAEAPPSDPTLGQKWLDTTSGIEYTYVIDEGETVGQWVNLDGGVDFSNLVHKTGDEAIAGVKTLSDSPVVPEPTSSDDSLKVPTTSWTRKLFTSLRDLTSLGWGQTWQNVTASRVAGTVYTNDTGRPIQVNMIVTASSAGTSLSGYVAVSGITVCNVAIPPVAGYTPTTFFSFIVPNGATYTMSMIVGSLASWAELR